jgi:acyl-CoA thioesterase-1
MKGSIGAVLFIALMILGCKGMKPKKGEDFRPAAPAASPDRGAQPVIVAFGDSLTAGAGVDPEGNYPSLLQRKIDAKGYRYRVVNAGVSGETSAQGLNRVQSVIALRPAVVIVEFGGNDGLRGLPADATRKNLSEIVAQLEAAGARVVLAGMQIPPNYGPLYTHDFRGIFPAVADKYQIPLVPFFLEGVGGRPDLNQEDGIHPTSEGYARVVETLWKVLQPLL